MPRSALALLAAGFLATAASAQPPASMVGVQDVAWSADGRSVLFSAMRVKADYSDYQPDKWGVYRYELATGEVRLVAPRAFSVASSPVPGRIVVGLLDQAGNRDLVELDPQGRQTRRLTDHPAEDYGAAWSPDGRTLAYVSKRTGRSEVFLADADGANPRRLVDAGTARTYGPSWSPDGRHLAYYREVGDGADQVHVIRADGTGDVNVTRDGFNNVYPGWTPGGRVVYGQGRKGGPPLAFTVAPDGSGKAPLLGLASFYLRYSPDGARLAYLEAEPSGGGVRIVIVAADGGLVARVPLETVGGG